MRERVRFLFGLTWLVTRIALVCGVPVFVVWWRYQCVQLDGARYEGLPRSSQINATACEIAWSDISTRRTPGKDP